MDKAMILKMLATKPTSTKPYLAKNSKKESTLTKPREEFQCIM
jgi:hypothetical protein